MSLIGGYTFLIWNEENSQALNLSYQDWSAVQKYLKFDLHTDSVVFPCWLRNILLLILDLMYAKPSFQIYQRVCYMRVKIIPLKWLLVLLFLSAIPNFSPILIPVALLVFRAVGEVKAFLFCNYLSGRWEPLWNIRSNQADTALHAIRDTDQMTVLNTIQCKLEKLTLVESPGVVLAVHIEFWFILPATEDVIREPQSAQCSC